MAETRMFLAGHRPPDGAEGPALWFAVRGRELLVHARGGIEPLPAREALPLEPRGTHYLGALGALHCWSVELAPDAEPPEGMAFRDLRQLYAVLDTSLHAVAGRAVQIVEWDRTHRFCGACGAPTAARANERSRVCTACGLTQFPRIAPAVIVAVTRGDEILLGRSAHFPPGIYSVLAGFVEPGESLEQAVFREVLEETGIEVEDVRYFGSQPWPFPHSLMLGFTARHRSGELRVDGVELVDARWFHRDDMPMQFPGNVSISQWLIRDFLAR
ncbi:MAG TPA: NAD(+) diphosphatase [Myxococcota bacterium]|jgi:NAD+ diphosphatase